MRSLRAFIRALRREGEIVEIYPEVDPFLEVAEIHRRVVAQSGPALFFHRVKGSPFPIVTNLFGSEKRVLMAFPTRPEERIASFVSLVTQEFPPTFSQLWRRRRDLASLLQLRPKWVTRSPLQAHHSTSFDLNTLPLLTSWPEDGGPFLTLPLVYTEPLMKGPSNLGMYRIQRFSKDEMGLHFQIGKGGGFHFHSHEEAHLPLPVTIFLGGPPALIFAAIAPLPENVPELLFASFLMGERLSLTSPTDGHPHPLISECEFAIQGYAPPKQRREEGPFGDHYGYYSLQHPFPFLQTKTIYHREGAIYPATVVGKPRQEDFYIGEYLQKLLEPLFPLVMPQVRSLKSYGESGFHSLAAAIVHERYEKEALSAALRILGEGQLALTKFLLITDQRVDLLDIASLLRSILERFRPECDLLILPNTAMDTLDYTGTKLNHGSKGVLFGMGPPRRILPTTFTGEVPLPFSQAAPFTAGCLLLQAPPFSTSPDLTRFLNDSRFGEWPLIIFVDDCEKTLESQSSFLWTVFTRFNPASDIVSPSSILERNTILRSLPITIDARMKPSYPKTVEVDDETFSLVSRRWKEYFPSDSELYQRQLLL